MFKFTFVIVFLFLLGCSSYSKNNQPKVQTSKWEPLAIFQDFWKTAEDNVYPLKLKEVFFTPKQYSKLKIEAEKTANLKELAFLFNQFLDQLKVSHTHFYTKEDLDFYFFRSLFTTRELDQPTIWHIGSEYQKTTDGFIVRSVLDGFPAKKSVCAEGILFCRPTVCRLILFCHFKIVQM